MIPCMDLQEFQKCQDEFWGCLGFKVPFEFPKCSTMYKEIDDEIAKYSSYREYLKAKEAVATWPEDGRAYELLGDTAAALELIDEARAAYSQALELDPFLVEIEEKLTGL